VRPQGKDPLVAQNEELERKVAHLEHRLQQAEKIIEVQKKLSELLGLPMPDNSAR
jgi:cell shape-determining protein MreC